MLRQLVSTRRTALGLLGTTIGLALAVRSSSAHQTDPVNPIPQPEATDPEFLIARAFEMRNLAVTEGDQAYGALIATADGVIVGQTPSRVVTRGDPTAHAEMEAIRDAARRLGTRNLRGYVIYSSSHPCPMCEAAAYWAGIERMVHGRNAADAGAPKLCG